jgi:hypothetical protein
MTPNPEFILSLLVGQVVDLGRTRTITRQGKKTNMHGCCVRAQVPVSDRTTHINTLMRQLVEWALSSSSLTTTAAAAAAAAATASRLGQQLQLHDHTAATAGGVLDSSSSSSRARQQQLLQLPLDSSEESVLVAVLRERMSAGKTGGHLLPLYLLQVCDSW